MPNRGHRRLLNVGDRRLAVLVVALVALAALVRLPGLDSGLWYDEILTVVETVRPPFVQVVTTFPSDNNHPLYSVLAQGIVAAFGEHAWSLRLPALVFGVAAVPLLYLLASSLASRIEAILASLLLAVSYHGVWFSQNARGYTALLFFTLLATLLFVNLVRGPRRGPALAYGVVVALGVYTHLTMAFVAVAQALIWIWVIGREQSGPERSERMRMAGLSLASAAVLSALLYLPMVGGLLRFFNGPHQRMAAIATPAWAAFELLRGLRVGFGTVGVLAVFVLAVLGTVSFYRRDSMALLLFVLPGLITVSVIRVMGASMRPRFFFSTLGFALILLVRGAIEGSRLVTRTASESRAARIGGTAIVGAMVVVSALALRDDYRYPKQDFEGARHYVESHRAATEEVVTAGTAAYPYARYYGTAWKPFDKTAAPESLRSRGGRVWVVYSSPEYMNPRFVAFLDRECRDRRVFHGTVGGGDVIVCTIDAGQAR